MREFDAPAIATPDPQRNLADLPRRQLQRHPERPLLARRDGPGWQDVTAAEFAREVDELAKGLISSGLQVGDRLAIMSSTRYEWTLFDFAAWTAGLVVVPVYESSSPDQLAWILEDSGAAALVVEDGAKRAEAQSVQDRLPTLEHIWQIEGDDSLAALVGAGRGVEAAELEARRSAATGSSLATIIYTSGTTGRPKGCMLTHANFIDLAENAADRLAAAVRVSDARTLLFLPLAHVFARYVEVLCLATGAQIALSSNIKTITTDLGSFKPTFVMAMPRIFEKVYNSAEQRAMAEGKGKIFHAAAQSAMAYSRAQDSGGPGLALRIQHAIYSRLVYGKLRAVLGGQLRYAISGSAPLGLDIGHFFRGIGVTILEGYGLTETTAPLTVNTPDLDKMGTVGRPLPGNAVRIADDGEILGKGIAVFDGYWRNEQATAEAVVDGWFHTGDLGSLDDEGFLKITGRKKEILVTAGGKNVAPAVLEDQIRANPVVSQVIVLGDRRPFVAALVTLDLEMVPIWAKAHHLDDLSADNAAGHPAIRAEVERAVEQANRSVSRAESIRKFAVLDRDFTVENGYLTPSLKLKRAVILGDFAQDVERLYGADN